MSLTIQVKSTDPRKILLFWEGSLWREVGKSLFFSELAKCPHETSLEAFAEWFALIEEKVGKRYALHLLSKRSFLALELEERLVSKGLSPTAARSVLCFCQSKGYLDDAEEMKRLIGKERKKGKSTTAIFFKLKAKKGIDPSFVRACLKDSSDSEALRKQLSKYASKLDLNHPVEKQKVAARLLRKGFSFDAVIKALSDI